MREKARKIKVCLMLICALVMMPLVEQVMLFEGTAIVAEAASTKGVKLNKSSLKLNKGKSYTLKVANASGKKVKWYSKNRKIATVTSKGKVTAKGKGTTYIYAKVGSKTLKCKITVSVPAPKLSKSSITINKGKSYTLKVSNASSRVRWSVKNKKVATVTSKGKITAKGKGTTYVYAKVGKKTLKCKVTVKEPAVVRKYTMDTGKSKSLTFSGASSRTKWKSSDSSIVSVSKSKGKKVTVKARKVGKATVIAATSGKKTYQFVITVRGKSETTPSKPSTPQTEKPVRPSQPETNPPQTEKPETLPPQTEAPQTETNPPQTEVPKPPVETEKPVEPPKETESETAPETEPDTEPEKPKNFMEVDPRNSSLSVSGGNILVIFLRTNVPIDNISYTVRNVNEKVPEIGKPGFTKSASGVIVGFDAWIAGTYHITFTAPDVNPLTVSVTVTSSDPDWVKYNNWLYEKLANEWKADTSLETFCKMGVWLADNRDYVEGQTQFQKLYNMGGDCVASTMLFTDVAQRVFGLKAYNSNPGAGHEYALVEIGNEKWGFDAGFAGNAGVRPFSVRRYSSSGVWMDQWDYELKNGKRVWVN